DTAPAARSCARQASLPDARDVLDAGQPCPQRLLTEGRDAIRIAAVVRADSLDQPAGFEPRDRAVQRTGSQAQVRDAGDVFGHRIPVFRSVGEADENQQRRLRETSELFQLPIDVRLLHPRLLRLTYYVVRISTSGVAESQERRISQSAVREARGRV